VVVGHASVGVGGVGSHFGGRRGGDQRRRYISR